MAHAAHALADVAHRVNSMRLAESGPEARCVMRAVHTARTCVASANISGVSAVHCLGVLRMHCRLTRPVRIAHDPAEVQAVIVCDLPPTFVPLELPHDRVETLTGCGSQ